MTEVSACDALG